MQAHQRPMDMPPLPLALAHEQQALQPTLAHRQFAEGAMDKGADGMDEEEQVWTSGNAPYRGDEEIISHIVHEGKARLSNTLVGQLATHIRSKGPTVLEVLVQEVTKKFEVLRKPDGSKYRGSIPKAVQGALFSAGVFKKETDGSWSVADQIFR
jgi:hypothetical protein